MRSLFLPATLALLVSFVQTAEAQSFVELLDEARLFAEPDPYADVVATVPEEAVGELLRCRTSWCEVRFGGEVGYVKQRNLMATDRRPPAPSSPAPPSPAPTQPPALALEPALAPTGASLPTPRPEPLHEATPITLPLPAPVPAPVAAAPDLPPAAAPSSVLQPTPASASPPSASEPIATIPTPTPARAPQTAASPPPAADPVFAERRLDRLATLKNPAAGTLLSAILPGTGHLYAGEPGAGMVLLLTSISAPAVGYLLSDRTADLSCVPPPSDPQASCSDTTNYGPLFVGIGIAAAAWVAGLIDAGAAARRANEREQAARVRLDAVARPDYAGLALRVSL